MICAGAGARRPQSARVCSLIMGHLAESSFGVQRLYQATAPKIDFSRRPQMMRRLNQLVDARVAAPVRHIVANK